jgi:hypothetical protein
MRHPKPPPPPITPERQAAIDQIWEISQKAERLHELVRVAARTAATAVWENLRKEEAKP